MINVKDHKTTRFLDPWHYLGPKRRRMLEQSWAGLFKEHLLEQLPVHLLFDKFDPSLGRPTKELYTVAGAVLLQQAFDCTDQETVNQLAFNEQWHYALDITDESDESKYLSLKTLWKTRKIFGQDDIAKKTFDAITAKLAETFDVDFDKQRLDSVHIQSNMRRLGRIGLLAQTIKKFLVNLKRHHKKMYDGLDEELTSKYTKKKSLSFFAMVKPSESAKALKSCAKDLYKLLETFAGNPDVMNMNSYRLMVRVFDEQCQVSHPLDPEEPIEIDARPAKEVTADSIQNPSDPDATYDSHKGQGFKAQLMETYSDAEDPEQKAQTPDLISYIETQTASEHDSRAVVPAIESCKEQDRAPCEILADSHYGSDENCRAAGTQNVDLVSPVIGCGRVDQNKLPLSAFEFSEKLKLLKCPSGHAPVKFKKNNGRYSAAFDNRLCCECPHSTKCPAKLKGNNRRYLYYNAKEVRLSKRRALEQTEQFKQRYRMRAGVEATMSELDRLTGAKKLRVRGKPAVRLCITLKACALNIFRATRARRARMRAGVWPELSLSAFLWSISFFKERLTILSCGPSVACSLTKNFCRSFRQTDENEFALAA